MGFISLLPKRRRGLTKMKLTTTYASSPTREGILAHITRFYCGESKTLQPTLLPGLFAIISPSGRTLSTVVLETKRGFYFGLIK